MNIEQRVEKAFDGKGPRCEVVLDVTGRSEFPIDMLRFARLIPADIEACNNIVISFGDPRNRTVKLRFADYVSVVTVTQGALRFASFGWTVTGIETTSLSTVGGDV